MTDKAHESFGEHQRRRHRQWRTAWATLAAEVPREAFVPDVIWMNDPEARGLVPLSRQDDPEAWATAVAADAPVVAQVDLGRVRPGQQGTYASSWVCAPSAAMDLVITMDAAGNLGEADIAPRQRVLEIGTGTGWTTALLAHLLGPEARIVSLKVVPQSSFRLCDWLRDQLGDRRRR